MSMLKMQSRISKYQDFPYRIVNDRSEKHIYYKVYNKQYNSLEDAISAAIDIKLPLSDDRDYIISYIESLYLPQPIRHHNVKIFCNFTYIIYKTYYNKFTCNNLNNKEQIFIDAIMDMKIEDKLKL